MTSRRSEDNNANCRVHEAGNGGGNKKNMAPYDRRTDTGGEMFGIESLDVLIGIITIYLIFALACTAIVEAISAWFGVRSKYLEASLKELLHGYLAERTDVVEAFFQHPIIQ